MLPDGRRIGPHLPLGHGMARAVDRAASIGADTLQVFTDNPVAWQRRAHPPAGLPDFRTRVEEVGLGPLAVHAAYLINLAGGRADFWHRSVDLLANELVVARTFGARIVNVHIGSHLGAGIETGVERVATAVVRAFDEAQALEEAGAARTNGEHAEVGARLDVDRPILVLENSAGSGDGLGVDVPELTAILEAIVARGVDPARVGFCLDTAHGWAAGLPFGTSEGVDGFLAAFDAAIGLERLRLVHLNDSRADHGSRTDRHEHLGAGSIGLEGLRAILTHPGLRHATYILETPGMEDGYDAVNLARARAIAQDEPLEPLAPEALVVKPGRSGSTAGPPEDPADATDALPTS
jgi:deoxyribonuclease-4